MDGRDGRGMRYLRAGIDRLAIPHVISACCMEQFFLRTFARVCISGVHFGRPQLKIIPCIRTSENKNIKL